MIHDEVKAKVEQALPGSLVEVKNTTSQHIGHDHGGAHLKVTVIYAGFKDKSVVEQHQMIYKILAEEMEEKIHALRIETRTE